MNNDIIQTKKSGFLFHLKNIFIFLGLYMIQQLVYEGASLPFIIGREVGMSRSISTVIGSLVLLLGIFVSYKIASHFKLVNLKNIFTKQRILIILIGYIIVVSIGYLSIFLQGETSILNRKEIYSNMFQNSSPIVALLQATFFAPIIEEVAFSGFIIGHWFRKSPKVGIVLSSILFGLIHGPGNIIVLLQYIGVGLVLGVIYYKYKRLEITTSIHILNNLPGGIEVLIQAL